MTRYLARRLLGAIPLVLGVATILFLIINLAPGDPALRYLSPNLSAQTLEQIRVNMGLDRPIHIRYLRWMAALARGRPGLLPLAQPTRRRRHPGAPAEHHTPVGHRRRDCLHPGNPSRGHPGRPAVLYP